MYYCCAVLSTLRRRSWLEYNSRRVLRTYEYPAYVLRPCVSLVVSVNLHCGTSAMQARVRCRSTANPVGSNINKSAPVESATTPAGLLGVRTSPQYHHHRSPAPHASGGISGALRRRLGAAAMIVSSLPATCAFGLGGAATSTAASGVLAGRAASAQQHLTRLARTHHIRSFALTSSTSSSSSGRLSLRVLRTAAGVGGDRSVGRAWSGYDSRKGGLRWAHLKYPDRSRGGGPGGSLLFSTKSDAPPPAAEAAVASAGGAAKASEGKGQGGGKGKGKGKGGGKKKAGAVAEDTPVAELRAVSTRGFCRVWIQRG